MIMMTSVLFAFRFFPLNKSAGLSGPCPVSFFQVLPSLSTKSQSVSGLRASEKDKREITDKYEKCEKERAKINEKYIKLS